MKKNPQFYFNQDKKKIININDNKKYYSLERHAEDSKNLLDQLNINEPVCLIIHSAGCFIVSCFAAKYPQLTKISGLDNGFVKIGNTCLNNENYFKNALYPSQRVNFFNNLGLKLEVAQEACKWSFNIMIFNANCLILNKDCMKYFVQINCEVLLINGDKEIFFVPDNQMLKKEKLYLLIMLIKFSSYENTKKCRIN